MQALRESSESAEAQERNQSAFLLRWKQGMLGEVGSKAWGGVFGGGSLGEGQGGGGSEHCSQGQELRERDCPVPSEVSLRARATAPSYSSSLPCVA